MKSVFCFLYILCLVDTVRFVKAIRLSVQTNTIEFCDSNVLLTSKKLELTSGGSLSSKSVSLSPQTFAAVCKLRVASPRNHVVNMQFIESTANYHRALFFNNSEIHPPCTMSIYLPDDPITPFWEGDPCSQDSLPEVDLLPPEFEIVWAPPPNPNHTKGRKFVLTAIGKGAICKEPGQHTCMRIGRQPVFCIPEILLCDGIHNCPKSSTKSDEDEEICSGNGLNQASWEQLAQEFAVKILKKFKPQQDDKFNNRFADTMDKQYTIAPKRQRNYQDWQRVKVKEASTTTTPKPIEVEDKPKATDSVSTMLSKYGPWGYLMMGLLICGTVLMFCGLWECCFRKPKNQIETSNTNQPTTVLIINQGEETGQVAPPNYDDLDEPPSYNTLFPNLKTVTSAPSSLVSNFSQLTDASSTTSYFSTISQFGENTGQSVRHVGDVNSDSSLSSDSSTSCSSDSTITHSVIIQNEVGPSSVNNADRIEAT